MHGALDYLLAKSDASRARTGGDTEGRTDRGPMPNISSTL